MGARNNFAQALYEMFGIGQGLTAEHQAAQARSAPSKLQASTKGGQVIHVALGTTIHGRMEVTGDVEITGEFQGELIATGQVRIYSSICGNITAAALQVIGCSLTGNTQISGCVLVDEGATLVGDISAQRMECFGHIIGDLHIGGHCSFAQGAVVEGNIITKTMTADCGAIISGTLMMGAGEGKGSFALSGDTFEL